MIFKCRYCSKTHPHQMELETSDNQIAAICPDCFIKAMDRVLKALVPVPKQSSIAYPNAVTDSSGDHLAYARLIRKLLADGKHQWSSQLLNGILTHIEKYQKIS